MSVCLCSLALPLLFPLKRLKMMVGDEQTDTSLQVRRKSLLTLDQQHSSSDIFVSISGLIGTKRTPVLLICTMLTFSPHPALLSLLLLLCRCWEDYSSNQTGREDESPRVLRASDRQCLPGRLLQEPCTICLSTAGVCASVCTTMCVRIVLAGNQL